jgi:hypothetical protein
MQPDSHPGLLELQEPVAKARCLEAADRLEATNSPSDRVVWIPIEGIYRMFGHVLRGTGQICRAKEGEAIPEENREVSAVVIKLRDPQGGIFLDQTINRQGKVAKLRA